MQKSNPSSDISDSLMMQTFANQHKSLLESRITASEICDKYQLLRKLKHVSEVFWIFVIILLNNIIQVSQEFDRFTDLTESMATFTTKLAKLLD